MTQDDYQIHLFFASPTSPSVHSTSPKDWWTGLWISLCYYLHHLKLFNFFVLPLLFNIEDKPGYHLIIYLLLSTLFNEIT